jgi:hypothetical protein
MEKYDSKKFSKHFISNGPYLGKVPMPRHYAALQWLLISAIGTILAILCGSLPGTCIMLLAALVSYYLYRKWKKELETDMEAENRKGK